MSLDLLASIERYAAELERIGSEPPPAPRWNQDWFPRIDAAAAYAMVRATRPQRIVEVGCGHSTRFLARAAADAGLEMRITAIDPQPRASLAGLNVRWLKDKVQHVDSGLFERLEANDILFIDSSHQLKPGSDVEHLFSHILASLKPGVRVHFHDIFLPDDYPSAWAWRRYNEQDAVSALMKHDYRLEFSSHQAVKAGKLAGVLARLPLKPGAIESSLWLRKN